MASIRRSPPPLRPTSIPYAATPNNIYNLEKYIRDQFASSVFNNSAPFPSLSGLPAKIHVNANAVPYTRHSLIPVPHHWKAAVKSRLDRDVERSITPVPIEAPVTWCSPMVVVSKSGGTPRRTIDFQKLNAQAFMRHITLAHHSSLFPRYHLTRRSLL